MAYLLHLQTPSWIIRDGQYRCCCNAKTYLWSKTTIRTGFIRHRRPVRSATAKEGDQVFQRPSQQFSHDSKTNATRLGTAVQGFWKGLRKAFTDATLAVIIYVLEKERIIAIVKS